MTLTRSCGSCVAVDVSKATDKGVVFGDEGQEHYSQLCDAYGLDCDDEATPDEANIAQHLWKGGHPP